MILSALNQHEIVEDESMLLALGDIIKALAVDGISYGNLSIVCNTKPNR